MTPSSNEIVILEDRGHFDLDYEIEQGEAVWHDRALVGGGRSEIADARYGRFCPNRTIGGGCRRLLPRQLDGKFAYQLDAPSAMTRFLLAHREITSSAGRYSSDSYHSRAARQIFELDDDQAIWLPIAFANFGRATSYKIRAAEFSDYRVRKLSIEFVLGRIGYLDVNYNVRGHLLPHLLRLDFKVPGTT